MCVSYRTQVDCLVRFDDKTFGVIDFKTSQSAKSALYARQLHAYAYALESPSPNSELARCRVSDMGLVVYTPTGFHTPRASSSSAAGGQAMTRHAAALTGELEYVHVPRDDGAFMNFLARVLDVLVLPQAPPPPPPARRGRSFSSCPYCQFLHEARQGGFLLGEG